MLIAAGITVKVEEANVNLDNKLRTDITAPNIKSKSSAKRNIQIDVTVANTLNPTVDKTPEQQIKERERNKLRHYAQLSEAESADIVPAVVTHLVLSTMI
jgi:protein required for attachment to host cells